MPFSVALLLRCSVHKIERLKQLHRLFYCTEQQSTRATEKTEKKVLILLGALISIFLPCAVLLSEEVAEKPTRPKVGLVLAGGGALGFAHVGVIKVLEEQRIPIDIVTGTSMGAIVGSAYAAGVSLEEMIAEMTSTDWDDLFGEEPDRASVEYRLKSGRGRELFGETKFSIQDGELVTPLGFIDGQRVLPLLQRLLRKVESPTDFDTLPLPFRAVAADIETGEAVIPKYGNLAQIVRASMSVPGVFAPIEVDGRVLVDGGIVNNVPIDQALALGADVLIVVELYTKFKSASELKGPFAISGQVIALMLERTTREQMKLMRPHDIHVRPDVSAYTTSSFGDAVPLMKIGEEEARRMIPALQKLSVDEATYRKYSERRVIPEPGHEVQFIRIKNQSSVPEGEISVELRTEVGSPLNLETLEGDIDRIYSSGRFSSVRYDIVREDGKEGIEITAKGKEWYKEFLRLGAAIEDDFDGNSSYSLAFNYRWNDLDSYGAFLDTQLEIGHSSRVFAEFYQPLGEGSPFFVAPEGELVRTEIFLRDNGETIAEFGRRQGSIGLKAGYELGRSGEALLGYTWGRGDFERKIGDPTVPELDYDVGEVYSSVELDTLDTPDFPTSGYRAGVSYNYSLEDFGGEENFNWGRAGFVIPYTWERNTFLISGESFTSFDNRPVERSISLGGFLDVSGYQRNSLVASDFHFVRAVFYRRFSELKIPLFGLGFFAGGSVEMGTITSDVESLPDTGSLVAGSAFLGADTPIFPLYLSFGLSDDDEHSAYLNIGRVGTRR